MSILAAQCAKSLDRYVKLDNISRSKSKLIIKHGHVTIFAITSFCDNSPAAKDPVPTLVFMTLFGNVYVHVQKRASDQYQCNERDKDSDNFQCPVAKRILIMQNDIFSIILKHEVYTIYDFIKCLF